MTPMNGHDRPTHPLNVSYLVVGLVFLGIAGSWALRAAGLVGAGDVRWLLPLVLVASGVVGLLAFAVKGLSAGRRRQPDAGAAGDAGDRVDPGYPIDPGTPWSEDTLLLDRRTDEDEGELR
jgi:hypothetical protein